MEKLAFLDDAMDLEIVRRKDKSHLVFSSPQIAESLKRISIYPIGLGIDPADKKNMNSKRSPFILGELATLYVAQK